MDDKTRQHFEMNVWNPGAMMENQIYDTCDNVLGTENHYCTPVPSNRTVNDAPTMNSARPLSLMSSKSVFKYTIDKRALAMNLMYISVFVLFVVLFGICGFALSEVKRLQGEVDQLKIDFSDLRHTQVVSVSNLTVDIQELTRRERELRGNFTEALVTMSGELSVNISQLQAQLEILLNDVERNLSLVKNSSSVASMELALILNSSVSLLSDDFYQFQNQSSVNVSILGSSLEFHTAELGRLESALLAIGNNTLSSVQMLNATISRSVEDLGTNISSLRRTAYETISNETAKLKMDLDRLNSSYAADIFSIEMIISDDVRSLEERIQHINAEIKINLTALQSEFQASLTGFEGTVGKSVSSLRDEVTRVELELSLTTHTNITHLGLNISNSLEELTDLIRRNFTDLEAKTENRLSDLSQRTHENLTALEVETHLALSNLLGSTRHNISVVLNQTSSLLEQSALNVRRELDVVTEAQIDLTNTSAMIQLSLSSLENATQSAIHTLMLEDNATSNTITRLELEVAVNFSQARRSFAEELVLLANQMEVSVSFLNSTDLQLFDQIMRLDGTVNLLEERQNLSQFDIVGLGIKIDSLRDQVLSIEVNVSSSVVQLDALSTFIYQQVHMMEISLSVLRSDLVLLSEESYLNFTIIENVTQSIDDRLTDIFMASQNLIQAVLSAVEMNITNLQTRLDANLAALDEHLAEELNQTAIVLSANIQQVNASTMQQLSVLEEEHTSDIENTVEHISISIGAVSRAIDNLSANATNVSSLLYSSITELDHLSVALHQVEENFTLLLNSTAEDLEHEVSELQADARLLTSSHAQLLNQVKQLNASFGNNLNGIESDIDDLRMEVATLNAEVVSNEMNTTLLLTQLTTFDSFVLNQVHTVNVSLEDLRAEVRFLSEDFRTNFTVLGNVTQNIEEKLATFVRSSENGLQDLTVSLRENLTQLQSSFNASVSIVEDQLNLTSTLILFRIHEINSSLHQQLAILAEQHTTDVGGLSRYINESIGVLSIISDGLMVEISTVSTLLNITTYDLDELSLTLSQAERDLIRLLNETAETVQRKLVDFVVQNVNATAESARIQVSDLRSQVYSNLTRFELRFINALRDVENITGSSTRELNSTIGGLQSEIYRSNQDLQDVIQQTNATLLSMLSELALASQAELSLSINTSSSNFATLQQRIDTVSLDTLTLYTEHVHNSTVGQNQTRYILDSLGSDVLRLMGELGQIQQNVSSVNNGVARVEQSFEELLNSNQTLYGGCVEESEKCTVTPMTFKYVAECDTDGRPLNVTDFVTLSMGCEQISTSNMVIETSVLKQNGSMVWCRCKIFNISSFSSRITGLGTITTTCSLKILRCPSTFQLT